MKKGKGFKLPPDTPEIGYAALIAKLRTTKTKEKAEMDRMAGKKAQQSPQPKKT